MPGDFKVCVVGGTGGIGQSLCMLMAMDPNVAELCVYDLNITMVPAEGVAADLSHMSTRCKVKAYPLGPQDRAIEKAEECLTGCHLVLVPAGVPRKPGQERAEHLKINATIAKNFVEACAKFCPDAMIALIMSPVNSIVPAVCEMWKKKGLDPGKIVGVTTIDVVRANKFVCDLLHDPSMEAIDIPVVGGHSVETNLPLFSHCKVSRDFPQEVIQDLHKKVQDAGTIVVAAKSGKGSATLSMAYAGARLGKAILSGLAGKEKTECAFVESTDMECKYFARKVTFGPKGIKKLQPLGVLSDYEQEKLSKLIPILQQEVAAGVQFGTQYSFAS